MLIEQVMYYFLPSGTWRAYLANKRTNQDRLRCLRDPIVVAVTHGYLLNASLIHKIRNNSKSPAMPDNYAQVSDCSLVYPKP